MKFKFGDKVTWIDGGDNINHLIFCCKHLCSEMICAEKSGMRLFLGLDELKAGWK